jgi:cardiolipin synthase
MSLRWIPNAICVARILLVAPIVASLIAGHYRAALLLFIVAGGSDGLDGFLAKRFDWRTRLGSLLDPLADKLLVIAVFVTLTSLELVPVLLAAIVVLRDAIILTGAAVYQWLVEPVRGEPTKISKLNTACQLAFVVFTITRAGFDWPPEISTTVLGAAVVFTSITSGTHYVIGWGKRAWLLQHAKAR